MAEDHPEHGEVHRHEPPSGFIRKYVFSIDHKVIGIQYWFLALAAVFIGMIMSLLMRLQLAWPGEQWEFLKTLLPTAAETGTISPELYLSLVTMHGTIMVFFVLTTAPQGGFGNYFLPIQIGAADMAFPVLNMLSFWVTFVSFVVMILAIFANIFDETAAATVVGPIGGWTGYAPLSALGEIAGPGQGTGVVLWVSSIGLFCVASLLGALNFITTMLNLRTRGMSLLRLPLTCWAWFTTAVLGLLSFPVLLAAGVLLIFDHVAHTSFFVPAASYVNGKLVLTKQGGSVILWQHLFWYFGHPEVYIAILPWDGPHVAHTFDLCAKAYLRLPRDGLCDIRHRAAGIFRLGPSHVPERDGPAHRHSLFARDARHRRALGDQDVQLDRNTLGWSHTLHHADALFDRLCVALCLRRDHWHLPRPDGSRHPAP
jgi:cytochrome c oxidase subunit 1